jgi:FkbM family methyltransferase
MELTVSSNPHYFTPITMKPWNPDGTVIDVGSCEGLFGLRAIREFKSKQVLAVEPGAVMAGLLKETFDANQCGDRVKVAQCLLGKQRGMAAFRECLSDPALSSVEDLNETNKEFAVKIVPLDDLVDEQKMAPVRAIKIDAEGADLDILMGAENLIRQWRPHLLVTTYHVAEHALQMRNWLESLNLGYTFVFRGVVMAKTSKVRPVLMLASTN